MLQAPPSSRNSRDAHLSGIKMHNMAIEEQLQNAIDVRQVCRFPSLLHEEAVRVIDINLPIAHNALGSLKDGGSCHL